MPYLEAKMNKYCCIKLCVSY